MFPTSTQRRHWMFENDSTVNRTRLEAHEAFVARHGADLDDQQKREHFLTAGESDLYLRFYEKKLIEFCAKFKPPMPKATLGTAVQYYKRFYMKNSVMDYHPKEIL